MADPPMPPPVNNQGPPFQAAAPTLPRTGLAVTTLVLGIVGLVACPLLGIVAIITGIIALVRIGDQPGVYGGRGMAIGGLVCGGASLVVMPFCASIMLPSLSRARELSKRLVCSSNLKGIGTSMLIYRNDYPVAGIPSIDWLIDEGWIDSEQTVCPSSDVTASNYILLSGNFDAEQPGSSVIMYEPKANHGGEGGNVLFADGHVEFVRSDEYDRLIQALSAEPP